MFDFLNSHDDLLASQGVIKFQIDELNRKIKFYHKEINLVNLALQARFYSEHNAKYLCSRSDLEGSRDSLRTHLLELLKELDQYYKELDIVENCLQAGLYHE